MHMVCTNACNNAMNACTCMFTTRLSMLCFTYTPTISFMLVVGAAQEAPDIGQWEGQDVPLVRPSSCNVKGGIPSSRRYLPTFMLVPHMVHVNACMNAMNACAPQYSNNSTRMLNQSPNSAHMTSNIANKAH